jgi:enterochelin esterase family protein
VHIKYDGRAKCPHRKDSVVARVDARLFLSCGTFESRVYYNRSLVPRLRSAGLQLPYAEAWDGHNWTAWRDRLREGRTYLFPGRRRMVYE